MFILDSLMISGISWALRTLVEAADAEMNDDSALREALLEAEMRREMGEISDDEFAGIEADLLARIREIKERREGGSGPLAIGSGEPIGATGDSRFQVEASVSGDFHDPADAPHTTIVDSNPGTGWWSAPTKGSRSQCSTWCRETPIPGSQHRCRSRRRRAAARARSLAPVVQRERPWPDPPRRRARRRRLGRADRRDRRGQFNPHIPLLPGA
jgi:hypothetical protein